MIGFYNIGSLIILIGFWGQYTIITIKSPQNGMVTIEAPMVWRARGSQYGSKPLKLEV